MYLTSEFNLDKKIECNSFTIAYKDYCCSYGLTDQVKSNGLILILENNTDLEKLSEGIEYLKTKTYEDNYRKE